MKSLFVALLTLLILMTGRAFAAEKQAKPPVTPRPSVAMETAPVVLEGRELFRIRNRVLSLSPEERARAINTRLSRLAENPITPPNPVKIFEGETSSDLFAGEVLIMVVTEQDAATAGKARPLLAREYADRINATLETHREERSLRRLLLGGLYALLATVALIVLLLFLRLLFSRIYATIGSWRTTRLRSVKIQSFEVITADRMATGLLFLTRGLRVALVLLLIYVYIPLVFSFFPWTSGYATTFLDYAMAPLNAMGTAVVTYLPKLVFVAVIILVMRYVIKGVGLLFGELEKGSITISGFYPEWSEPTFKIVRFLLIAFTAVIVFPYLPGSDSPAFKGVSLFLGVLFSLGSSSAVANIIAGVILTYTRAFSIGDRVRINDNTGDVIEKSLLATHIRTIKNVEITIPNSLVLGSHILNYSASSREACLILHTSVTIGYDAPWRRVQELLISAALATEHVRREPRPFVLQTALNDFYVTYELNACTDEPHAMAQTYSDLHRNIQDAFNEGGVEIMSPHYAQIRDGNRTTIPDEYLAEGYEAGGFRIERTGKDVPHQT
jgi:small-conductance mechanosensitive channel